MLSHKCRYALRAVFELAKRHGSGPVRGRDIAASQAIPPRFLEIILNQLKQGGFIESRRGSEGGYLIHSNPRTLRVGEIIRFIEGPPQPVECLGDPSGERCTLHERRVFVLLWERVQKAVSDIYDQTTFQDLIEQEARMHMQTPSFEI